MSQAFPDRKLYLFDTFEGFDRRDVDLDKEKGFSGEVDDFSSTSMAHVSGQKHLLLEQQDYFEDRNIKCGHKHFAFNTLFFSDISISD